MADHTSLLTSLPASLPAALPSCPAITSREPPVGQVGGIWQQIGVFPSTQTGTDQDSFVSHCGREGNSFFLIFLALSLSRDGITAASFLYFIILSST